METLSNLLKASKLTNLNLETALDHYAFGKEIHKHDLKNLLILICKN